jgi:hypothetical protein
MDMVWSRPNYLPFLWKVSTKKLLKKNLFKKERNELLFFYGEINKNKNKDL